MLGEERKVTEEGQPVVVVVVVVCVRVLDSQCQSSTAWIFGAIDDICAAAPLGPADPTLT